jgi:hypothetical protein
MTAYLPQCDTLLITRSQLSLLKEVDCLLSGFNLSKRLSRILVLLRSLC